MAIVRNPALSTDASGNLGDICYTRIRNVNIARDTWTGTVPNTSEQQTYQGNLTTVSQYWGGTLDGDERLAWEKAAEQIIRINRLGIKYIPTGYQYFLEINMKLLAWGKSIRDTPPWNNKIHIFERLAAVPIVGLPWAVIVKAYPEGTWLSYEGMQTFKAGPYDSGGRKPISGEWRFVKVEFGPGADNWTDGDRIVGKWYWYKARQINDQGYAGLFLYIQSFVLS